VSILRKLNNRGVAAAAVSAAFLVPLGVFGAPALARGSASSSAQYQYKIAVCHKTHSAKHPWVLIHISSAAWKAHAKHGDLLVPPATCPPKPTAPTAAAATHGNGSGNNGNGNNGNGNNGNHGNGNNGSNGNGHHP